DHNTPPTLTPAQAPPLSLISVPVESQNSSPRILPPASTERVRSLSHPGSEAHDISSHPHPPFHAAGKSPPGIHLNLLSAEVMPGEEQVLGSATASLSRLTQMAQDSTTPDEAHFIEMTTLSTETVPMAMQEEYEEDQLELQSNDLTLDETKSSISPQTNKHFKIQEDNLELEEGNLSVERSVIDKCDLEGNIDKAEDTEYLKEQNHCLSQDQDGELEDGLLEHRDGTSEI
ncbi:uncharacterized protein LOC117119512, partial [Anneissia japonica]|uniref:uncharacterized protein LOC117119512 n=1 Tax=Anneissia japonica TaxID=1529436 RepID=UPI0014255207